MKPSTAAAQSAHGVGPGLGPAPPNDDATIHWRRLVSGTLPAGHGEHWPLVPAVPAGQGAHSLPPGWWGVAHDMHYNAGNYKHLVIHFVYGFV